MKLIVSFLSLDSLKFTDITATQVCLLFYAALEGKKSPKTQREEVVIF